MYYGQWPYIGTIHFSTPNKPVQIGTKTVTLNLWPLPWNYGKNIKQYKYIIFMKGEYLCEK